MRIYTEQSLNNFEFWSGAMETVNELTFQELEQIENELEALYPDGMEDTELNDFFWFEEDEIANMLGYGSWEGLCRVHQGLDEYEDEYEEEDEEEEDEDEDEDED